MEKVIEKVRKLFAKASDNPFEAEANVCILKAQKLMVENGLSKQDIVVEEYKKESVYTSITPKGRTIWWKKTLSAIIAENFRCYSIINSFMDAEDWRKSSTQISFLGLKEDVELALQVFEFAVEAIEYNAKRYVNSRKKMGFSTKGIKNDYIRGFLLGLNKQFKEQVNSNNWALVLVKDEVVVKAHEEMDVSKAWVPKGKGANNNQAINKGIVDGMEFKVASGRLKEEGR